MWRRLTLREKDAQFALILLWTQLCGSFPLRHLLRKFRNHLSFTYRIVPHFHFCFLLQLTNSVDPYKDSMLTLRESEVPGALYESQSCCPAFLLPPTEEVYSPTHPHTWHVLTPDVCHSRCWQSEMAVKRWAFVFWLLLPLRPVQPVAVTRWPMTWLFLWQPFSYLADNMWLRLVRNTYKYKKKWSEESLKPRAAGLFWSHVGCNMV